MKISIYFLSMLLLLSPAMAQPATLSLRECLNRASASNISLKVAAYDEKIAGENVTVAKSGFLPRVDVQGGYVAQLEPQAVNFGPKPMETQQADFAFFNFSISETLYDFGRTSSRQEQATLRKEVSQNNFRSQEQDVFLQVVRAYYGILEAQKNLTVADDEGAQMNNHRTVAQNLYDQGVVTRNDLLQAEVRLAAARQKRFAANNAVENGWLYLNFLTGQPANQRGELEEVGGIDPAIPLDIPLQPNFSARSELTVLKKSIAADELAIKEINSTYYPELFAKLSLDYVQNNKVREQAIMAATVGLKVNLYDGQATTSHLRQAVTIRAREEEKLRDLEARLNLELQLAGNDLKVAAARITVAETAIHQAEENLRINSDKYQEQVGTATAVIDAQTLLTQTRSDYYRALFDFQVAAARVKRATGEL